MSSRWVDEQGTLHEHCRLRIFIGAQLLDESSIDPGDCPEVGWARDGVAYFCRDCGSIWARMDMIDSLGSTRPWTVMEAPCDRHSSQWNVAGSLLAAGEGWLQHLPPAAVRRELEVHLKESKR